jgi:hypothetical protein
MLTTHLHLAPRSRMRGVIPPLPQEGQLYLYLTLLRWVILHLWPTQPPIQWDLSLGVKRPEREADHSPPSSAEVKNAWSYTSAPQHAFMAWRSVKKSTGTTLPLPYLIMMTKVCQLVSTLYTVMKCCTGPRQALVNTAINIQFPQKVGNFLISWVT